MRFHKQMKCQSCGVCCKLFVINLNQEEYESGKYKTFFASFGKMAFSEAELVGGNLIKQHEDESCIYLLDERCSIHDDRPQVCKEFFCDSDDEWYQEMIEKIRKYKENST